MTVSFSANKMLTYTNQTCRSKLSSLEVLLNFSRLFRLYWEHKSLCIIEKSEAS